MSEIEFWSDQLKKVVLRNVPQISTVLPSDWTEQNMIMGKPFPGPFRYKRTPYTREIIDILHPDNPIQVCNVKKGGQIGFSSGVIYPGICWIIKNNPGNISLSVGSPDLINKAMAKVDAAIDSTRIRGYIQHQAKRKRNNKSGDTNLQKDFSNGFLMLWSAGNHKNIRQVDLETQFNDDFVAIKKASKESGSTRKKLDQRSAAYKDSRKIFNISTPELEGSNIDIVYLEGDQRKFFVPCPCCKGMITIEWATPSLKVENKMAGMTWQLNELGQVKSESVGYICQLCDEFFNDKNKQEWLNKGEWRPTAIPINDRTRSYHISALYAPIGMFDWEHYVGDYIAANPAGQPRDEAAWQQFKNEVLGESYTPPATQIESRQLEKNIRSYAIGTVPDALSVQDGNGHIVLLTLVCDLGGRYVGDQIKSTYDDARLDWEIVGIAESGSKYSIDHGSIGTFTNAYLGQKDEGREVWSYDPGKPNNVWRELDKIRARVFQVGKNKMNIQVTGIDSGFAEHYVFGYIDSRSGPGQQKIIGLKGDKENKPRAWGTNQKNWKLGMSRANLFMLEVGHLKDYVAGCIAIRWDGKGKQPSGYMNFPQRNGGKYELENYFLHFESEHRVVDEKKGTFIWEKKSSNVQNHIFDLAVYTVGVKEILMHHVLKDIGADPNEATWRQFSEWLLRQWGLTSALTT